MVNKWFFNYFALKEARDIHVGKPPPASRAAQVTLNGATQFGPERSARLNCKREHVK
jgi:hypothetical protein